MTGKPQWLALLLSFVFGAFVLSALNLKKMLKVGFWFVNSLIIFSVSIGTAKFAAERAENASASIVPAASGNSVIVPANGGTDLLGLLVPSADAQDVSTSRGADQAAEQQKQLLDELQRENQMLKQELRGVKTADARATAPEAARLEAARKALAAESKQVESEAARLQNARAALENAKTAELPAKQKENPRSFFKKW